jgi:hypothetical protein
MTRFYFKYMPCTSKKEPRPERTGAVCPRLDSNQHSIATTSS